MQFNDKNKGAILFIMLYAVCLVFGTGCKKFVEIDPPISTLTTAEVFNSNAQANAVLAGLYSTFNTSSSLYAGISGDEILSYNGVLNPLEYQFSSNQLLASNPLVDAQLWLPLYKSIYNANTIIQGVAASTSTMLNDSTRNQLVGEAKIVRAFSYFYLTNFFGDVPLALSINFKDTGLLPRTPQAKVYEQIVQDLLDAQAVLPEDYKVANDDRIRPNKWAATALLARTYLYMKRYRDAEVQATAIINNIAQYELVTPLTSVFNKTSKEAIWELLPNTTVAPYGIIDQSYFAPTFLWSSLSAFEQLFYLSSPSTYDILAPFFIPKYVLTPQLASAFENNDKRKSLWTGNTPSPAVAPYNGVVNYFPLKYTQSLTPNSVPTQGLMLLRVAEQYLIRAEARAQQNNLSGATEDIDKIRTRAGLKGTTATTQNELLDAVLQERRVELFSEWGHRFFDLKRTGKAVAVLSAITTKQPWSDSQLLYPIPPKEIGNDPNLTQNPGY